MRIQSVVFIIFLVLISTFSLANSRMPQSPENLRWELLAPSAVSLAWEDRSDNELGFRIERKVDEGFWQLIGLTPPNVTSYESVGLLSGLNHAYAHRVFAFNETGNSTFVDHEPISLPHPFPIPKGEVMVASSEERPRAGEGSLVRLSNGDLVYYFSLYEGSAKDFAHGVVAVVRSENEGADWSEPEIVFRDERARFSRVAAIKMANGDIGLSYGYHMRADTLDENMNRIAHEDRATIVFRYSEDEGRTWSEEFFLGDDLEFPTSHSLWDSLHLLSNGRILTMVQASRRQEVAEAKYGTYFRYSDDHGRTWARVPDVGRMIVLDNPYNNREVGLWEVALVEYQPGHLLAHGRTVTGWLYEMRSEDYGETWTQPKRLAIQHPKAPPVLESIPGSDTILRLWNPYVDPFKEEWHLGARFILACQLSDDGGESWYGYKEIEYTNQRDWYCYPSTLWVGEDLHLAYFSWPDMGSGSDGVHRSDVRYQKLNKEWLLKP